MEIRQIVLQTGTPRFDMVGRKLPSTLHDTDKTISKTLVDRLFRYAKRDMVESGFDVEGWDCEVYTMDADLLVNDRSYTVDFINAKGGKIGVCGILINNGKPVLDHGIFAERS